MSLHSNSGAVLFVGVFADAPETWIRVNWMLQRLHTAAPGAAVTMFLDCCREVYGSAPNDPPVLVGDRFGFALGCVTANYTASCPSCCWQERLFSCAFVCSHGYVLVFASEEGNFSREHSTHRNSYFTTTLLHQLETYGHVRPLSKVLDGVSEAVRAATGGRQIPAAYRTAKEDITLVELLGSRSLPTVGPLKASLRNVVVPLCTSFTQQVRTSTNYFYHRWSQLTGR